MTKPRQIKEADLHKAAADFLKWALLPPAFWTTFPAGWGVMHPATSGRLKGSGLKAGFPDIFVIFNGRITGIELKAPGGVLTKVQRDMHMLLRGAGMMTYVCHSIEEIDEVLGKASLPHRSIFKTTNPYWNGEAA